MPLIKWQPPHVLQQSTAPPPAQPLPAQPATPIVTKRARPQREKQRYSDNPRETQRMPLQDSTTLTPGGHRKHTLQRTTPGGTKRISEYVSPRKGDPPVLDKDGNVEWLLDYDSEVEQERFGRRSQALSEVAGQLTEAQRTAQARAKRKAGVPSAPQAKRGDRKEEGTAGFSLFSRAGEQYRLEKAAQGYLLPREWISM